MTLEMQLRSAPFTIKVLLSKLVQPELPPEVTLKEEVVFLAHSVGGSVSRSQVSRSPSSVAFTNAASPDEGFERLGRFRSRSFSFCFLQYSRLASVPNRYRSWFTTFHPTPGISTILLPSKTSLVSSGSGAIKTRSASRHSFIVIFAESASPTREERTIPSRSFNASKVIQTNRVSFDSFTQMLE